MNKESSHRSNELKLLGWNQEDITRYEELWEYSQRWGLINLEREDRSFLKKAEKLIPKLQPKKNSNKKSIEEKSYFLWLNFYLERIQEFNKKNLSNDVISIWNIFLEEELLLLKKHKPVMGLPDTLKAKELYKIRKQLIEKAISSFKANNIEKLFDFDVVLDPSQQKISKSWKSIIENDPDQKNHYLVINIKNNDKYRNTVNENIEEFMINNYPSLKENL